MAAVVLKLIDDPTWTVRRQLAATIGELPKEARLDAAIAVLTRYGSDPVTVDATISGLRGSESEALGRVVQSRAADAVTDPVAMLAAAVARSGDLAGVQQIVARVAGMNTAPWQRLALLQGLDTGLVAPGGGRGGGRGRGGAPRRAAAIAASRASRSGEACRRKRRASRRRQANRRQAGLAGKAGTGRCGGRAPHAGTATAIRCGR